MKIKLDASIKEHRKIAELFRGCECEFKRSISGDLMGGAFISAMNSPHYPKFIVYRLGDVTTKKSITIDLDQAQMDLRMAIGTGIEFVGESFNPLGKPLKSKGVLTSINNQGVYCIDFLFTADEIKLCPSYLKSVGVEVEE